MSTEQALSTP